MLLSGKYVQVGDQSLVTYTSFDSRINAVLRTAPNKETYRQVADMIRSPRFELFRLETLPSSFVVVDDRQLVNETVSYVNPHEFTMAIANYDDSYLAEKYITYFQLLKWSISKVYRRSCTNLFTSALYLAFFIQ